jgi:hypothetical protein
MELNWTYCAWWENYKILLSLDDNERLFCV